MSWVPSSLISGGLIATGSAALFLAVWIAKRLWNYRSASDDRHEERRCCACFVPTDGFLFRLVSEEDFDFLARLPGYRPGIGRRLRRARAKTFRLYLREIAAEFRQLRSPMASGRQGIAFWGSLAAIELSLAAGRFGRRGWGGAQSTATARALEMLRMARGSRSDTAVA